MGLKYGGTALLLHGDGANGSTVFADDSGFNRTVTGNGGAQISTAQSKFGGSSVLFNGNGAYLSVPASFMFAFGTGDFTVETWAYFNSLAVASRITNRTDGGYTGTWALTFQTDGSFKFTEVIVGEPGVSTAAGALVTGVWQHIVAARSNGTLNLFLSGNLVASGANTTNFSTYSFNLLIGRSAPNETGYLNGYLDDICITPGVARYTAAFTPPSAPLTAQDAVYAEASFAETKTAYSGDVGALPKGPVVMSSNVLLDTHTVDALPYGFPASQKSKYYDRFARSMTIDPEPFFDAVGYGRITGTVKEKGVPSNIPRKCLVFLYRHPDNKLVDVVWSDANGNYIFDGINPAYKYMTLAQDPTGVFRAVVADNLTPDAIPQPAY